MWQMQAISVKQPDVLTATVSPRAPASTNNADGKAKVSVKGGSGKYTYQWDNGENLATAEKLAAGKHVVTVTDENGCSTTASIEITENILELTLALEQKANIQCAGGNDAELEAIASGGKPPFQYSWSTPNGSETTAKQLSAGKYSLTLTDAAGTSKVAEATISEPKPLKLSADQTAPASANNADGKALAKASGGTGDYTFAWDNGTASANGINLSPGAHTVSVKDANGCAEQASITILENILPLKLALKQTAEINCNGEQTAGLEVSITGGKSPFSYEWSKAGLSGATASNLGAGEYSVKVTDASGLNGEAKLKISEPKVLSIEMAKPGRASDETSYDGYASLTVEGGTPEYTITWDNEETGLRAKKLSLGKHSVTVKDAKGCSVSQDFDIKKKLLPELTAGRLSIGQILQVSQIFFDADSTNMNPGSYPVVNEISDFLEENSTIVVEVGGHTNNVPPHEFCDKLSTGRAKSVAEYIVKKGIASERVVYKGYGKRKPKFSNKTADGRRRNQRVEIKILSLN